MNEFYKKYGYYETRTLTQDELDEMLNDFNILCDQHEIDKDDFCEQVLGLEI